MDMWDRMNQILRGRQTLALVHPVHLCELVSCYKIFLRTTGEKLKPYMQSCMSCVCVCVCVRVCVRACVHACVCMRAFVYF